MPDEPEVEPTDDGGGLFTGYGIASAVLGVVSVIAVAFALVIWSGHRDELSERAYQTDVLQAAADWTNLLVNMNKDSIDPTLEKLHDGTVGQLNADFESTVDQFKQLVQRLQSRTTGQVDSVAIESVHHDLPGANGARPAQPELTSVASRTDTVMVVATSVSENVGGAKPQTVRWNLRLGVSDVDGKLLISKLETLR
jgi:hypothetical protein